MQNPSPSTVQQYQSYTMTRTLPPEAKVGVMLPPEGDGRLIIDGQYFPLAPAAQFRSQNNLIVMPMTIQNRSDVVYLTDASGAIFRIWMISPGEATARPKN